MSEKRYEIKQNDDKLWWLFDTEDNKVLMISKNGASLLDLCTVLNMKNDTIEGLILDKNRQEEKLDIARRNMTKQLEKIEELQKENEQLRQRIKELQRSREYWIQDNNRLTKKNNELIAKIDFLERVIDGDV